MIENLNDLLSFISLIVIIIFSTIGFYKLDRSFKKDDEVDEYYRDLL